MLPYYSRDWAIIPMAWVSAYITELSWLVSQVKSIPRKDVSGFQRTGDLLMVSQL